MRAYADMCSTCGKLELGGVTTHIPDCPEGKDMANESRGIYDPDQVAAGEATARRMTQAMGRAQQGKVYVDGPEERHAREVESRQRWQQDLCEPEGGTPCGTATVSDVLGQVEVRVERLREFLGSPTCQTFDNGPVEDLSDRYLQRLRSLECALDACLRVVERL